MRRSKCFVVLLSFGIIFWALSLVYAQEWHTANQVTISWDEVTEVQGGAAIPESDIIEYRLYLSNAITDPDKTNSVEIGVTAELMYVVTLNTEGRFFVGLQTLRMDSDRVSLNESLIGWSDDPAIVLNEVTFGLRYFLPPLPPHNVTVQRD